MKFVQTVPATILLLCISTLLIGSCASHGIRSAQVSSAPGNQQIREKLLYHINDLEIATGMKFRGKRLDIESPIDATFRDWRKMPVATIRGRKQGGLTTWKISEQRSTVQFAQWKGMTPEWLIRHEALHVILLSHGITGHPKKFTKYFAKPYHWLPENEFL